MSRKKIKKSKKSNAQKKAAARAAAEATVIRTTASAMANAQAGYNPTRTAVVTSTRAAEQAQGGRLLTVEAQATTEIRPKEFIRVAIRLSARFPLAGDRTGQFEALAGAARGVLDAEIAWVHAPVDNKPATPTLSFPEDCWAREIGVSYGCTVKKIPRDPKCFEFVRAEVGCTEPLDDAADATVVMAAIQDWLAVQIREQVRRARGGQASTLV